VFSEKKIEQLTLLLSNDDTCILWKTHGTCKTKDNSTNVFPLKQTERENKINVSNCCGNSIQVFSTRKHLCVENEGSRRPGPRGHIDETLYNK
jgi:hypothetical protein